MGSKLFQLVHFVPTTVSNLLASPIWSSTDDVLDHYLLSTIESKKYAFDKQTAKHKRRCQL